MRRILFLLVCCFLGAGCAALRTVPVESAKDLKTIQLTTGQTVRLMGILPLDDPEKEREGFSFLQGMVRGREVIIESDSSFDREAGHLTGYVFFEIFPQSHLVEDMRLPAFYVIQKRKNKDGQQGTFVFLNATLIKAGYAQPVNIPSNIPYTRLFYELYEWARLHPDDTCYEAYPTEIPCRNGRMK